MEVCSPAMGALELPVFHEGHPGPRRTKRMVGGSDRHRQPGRAVRLGRHLQHMVPVLVLGRHKASFQLGGILWFNRISGDVIPDRGPKPLDKPTGRPCTMLSIGSHEGGLMRFVYMVTKGAGDPTLASIPLHMALNGSVEVGHDVAIVLVGDGTEVILGENPETLQGVGVPPMRELLDKARAHDVPIYV